MSKKVSSKKSGKWVKVGTIWKKVRKDLVSACASGLMYTNDRYFVTFNRNNNAALQFGTLFTQGIIARVAVDSGPLCIFIENTVYGGGHECLRYDEADSWGDGDIVSFERLSGKNILRATRTYALTAAVVRCERWREAREGSS